MMPFRALQMRPVAGGGGGGGGGGGSAAIRSSRIAWVNNASSLAFPFPAGAVAGDTCLAIAAHGYGVTTPAGWTSVDNETGSNINGAAFYKTLTSGDISTGTVTISFAGAYYGVVSGIAFVGAITSIRNKAFSYGPSGTTADLVGATGAVAGDIAIYSGMGRGNTIVTSTSGTQLQTTSNNEASGVLAAQTLVSGGTISTTFNYLVATTGVYDGIIIVQP